MVTQVFTSYEITYGQKYKKGRNKQVFNTKTAAIKFYNEQAALNKWVNCYEIIKTVEIKTKKII